MVDSDKEKTQESPAPVVRETTVQAKTIAFGKIDDLLVPRLDPGKACFLVIKGREIGRLYELGAQPMCLGRSLDCEITIEDLGVSRRHASVEPTSEGYVVRDLGSTNGLFVNGERVVRHPLKNGDRVQVGTSTVLKFCLQDELEESAQKRLYESATRDALSGAYNRQYLLDNLESEFAYCARHATALSLIFLDMDLFKTVNDRFGHLTGDYAIRTVADLVQEELRAEDILARYGGEEFAVMLRHADLDQAAAAAERIRLRVQEHPFSNEGNDFRLTVSAGVAANTDGVRDPNDLLRVADAMLYRAKQEGRNRVMVARQLPGPEEDRDITHRIRIQTPRT